MSREEEEQDGVVARAVRVFIQSKSNEEEEEAEGVERGGGRCQLCGEMDECVHVRGRDVSVSEHGLLLACTHRRAHSVTAPEADDVWNKSQFEARRTVYPD